MAYKGHQRNRRPAYNARTATAAISQENPRDTPITYLVAQQIWKRRRDYGGSRVVVETPAQMAIAPEVPIKGRSSADLAQLLLSMQDGIQKVTVSEMDKPYALNGHTVQLSKDISGDYTLTFTPATKRRGTPTTHR